MVEKNFNPENLTNLAHDVLHEGLSTGDPKIAFDWLSKTLYWTDPLFGWIAAARGDPTRIDKDSFKIIIRDVHTPLFISLDPLEG